MHAARACVCVLYVHSGGRGSEDAAAQSFAVVVLPQGGSMYTASGVQLPDGQHAHLHTHHIKLVSHRIYSLASGQE